VTCGDGERRRFVPGDMLIADDVLGRGHVSREIDGPRRQVYIYLDSGLDLDAFAVDGAST
jgi:hypothetical protein